MENWLPAAGQQWAARVACFADKLTRLEDCTLLLCRESGYEEPWVIVTDLPPQQTPFRGRLFSSHLIQDRTERFLR